MMASSSLQACLCPLSAVSAAYVETTFRDIAGPMHLVEWWDSHPSSAFKDYVLFLITMVMGTGSVERFFSFAKYTDMDQ